MAINEMKKNRGPLSTIPIYAMLTAVLLLVVSGVGQADTKNVRHVRTIKAPYDINWIAWHPNGEELAGGGNFNKAVTIWNTRTGDVVREIVGDDGGVASLAYSPDGRYLAVGRGFTRLTRSHVHLSIYDAKTGVAVRSFAPETPPSGNSNDVHAVAFSPDGRYVVATAHVGERNAVVYEVQTGNVVASLPSGVGKHINASVAYSPDGKLVLVGKYGGTIDVISTIDWKLSQTIRSYSETTVDSVAFCGGASHFVSGSSAVSAHYEKGSDKKINRYLDPIKLWSAETFGVVRSYQSDMNGSVNSIGCTPDGNILFAANGGKSVEIWDVHASGRREWLTDYKPTTYVQPAADGKRFAIASKKNIEIWEFIR